MLFKDWDLVLLGEHIRITPMQSDDEEPYARLMFGDMYERYEQICGEIPPSGIKKILSHEAEDETHALRLLSDERFIGWITLQKDHEGRPDIGISIIPECQNRGLGPEAIVLFANHLYDDWGIEKVYAHISEYNQQSQKAFIKVGAVFDKAEPNYQMKEIAERLPDGELKKVSVSNILYYHIDLPTKLQSRT